MAITVRSKPHRSSRLRVLIAKEMGDHFSAPGLSSREVLQALLLTPCALLVACLINGSDRDAFASDMAVRQILPMFFAGGALYIAATNGSEWFQAENSSRTLEPLFASGASRSEIVASKLVAWGTKWLAFVAIQIAMLAALPAIPAGHSVLPILSYFHPSTISLVQLGAVMFSSGMLLFATSGAIAMYATSHWPRRLMPLLGMLSLVSWFVKPLWLVTALMPYLNLVFGILAVFRNLPYDSRVGAVPHNAAAIWQHPYYADAVIVGGSLMAVFLIFLTTWKLRNRLPYQ